jgi:uncharacterized protein YndB with AHSA1/START domain
MTTTDLTVHKTITVNAPIDRAFRVFTEGFDRWWFRAHHLGDAELKEAVIECRDGGRWYEVGVDGSECDWGRVLAWEPPTRVLLAWQISAEWQFDPDLLTELEVRFVAEGEDRTRVELEHRNLDRYGDKEQAMKDSFDAPDGWQGLLEGFARVASA